MIFLKQRMYTTDFLKLGQRISAAGDGEMTEPVYKGDKSKIRLQNWRFYLKSLNYFYYLEISNYFIIF